jgi:hypothetical protein
MIISRCCAGPPVFPELDAECNIIAVKGPREPAIWKAEYNSRIRIDLRE